MMQEHGAEEYRPVYIMGMEIEGDYEWHIHPRVQLCTTSDGVITIRTDSGVWVVPPQRAVWIAGGVRHSVMVRHSCRMLSLYADPEAIDVPKTCRVVSLDMLTRALLLEASLLPLVYPQGGPEERLIQVVLDRLPQVEIKPLSIPRPADPRLHRLCDTLLSNPSDQRTLEELAGDVGMTGRTAQRLFHKETGMTFAQYRQQCRLLRALELLGQGEPVSRVASDVGYQDVSSFISMFRKSLGSSPSRYFTNEDNR
jgi:AraC-like DNA-binding protein